MGRGRNFGMGCRDVEVAGRKALNQAAQRGVLSYSSAATNGDRWKQFVDWAREREAEAAKDDPDSQRAVYLERITPEMVIDYGRELAEDVANGDIKVSRAQNLVSAINTVFKYAPRNDWKSVGPVSDCGLPERNYVRTEAPETLDRGVYESRLETVRSTLSERVAAVCELCRELGLRSKEASLINAQKTLKDASETGRVRISEGTKGGRDRDIEITSQRQIDAISRAAAAQGNWHSMIPRDQSWKQWRDGELRDAREAMGGLHELRAAYACERYQDLTGRGAPCLGVKPLRTDSEREARQLISEELGHNRIGITRSYLGSMK